MMGQVASVAEVEEDMELPCGKVSLSSNDFTADSYLVRVNLDTHGRQDGIDRSFTLSKSNPSIKVGRASTNVTHPTYVRQNNCFISSPITSRNHARFIFGDKYHPLKLVDEGSTHGTFVNMKRLRKGHETVLDNRSVITFGSEVLNGRCMTPGLKAVSKKLTAFPANYLPTSFTVTFMWHETPANAPTPAIKPPNIFRAPSPLGDSEDDEEQDEDLDKTTNVPKSPSVIVIDSPNIIDLTADTEPVVAQTPVTSRPSIFDQEDNMMHPGLTDSEGPEELVIVKETYLDPVSRPYRFDYAESDLEEEPDTTSQSSPPPEDFNSLYDASDVPANPGPSQNPNTNDKKDTPEQDELEESSGEDESHRDTESIPSPSFPSPSPFTYEDVEGDENEQSVIENEDDDSIYGNENDDSVHGNETKNSVYGDDSDSSDASSPSADSTELEEIDSYEKALNYLGASYDWDNVLIVNAYKDKTNEDPDRAWIAKSCLELIAEHRQSDHIWMWLDAGERIDFEFLTAQEREDSPPFSSNFRNDHEYYAPNRTLETINSVNNSGVTINAASASTTDPSYYPQLPYPNSFGLSQPNLYNLFSPPTFSGATFPTSYMAPYIPPTLNTGPSPVMQISNILDNTPRIEPLANDQKAPIAELGRRNEVEELESATEARNPEPEVKLPHSGRKRKFDDVELDEEDEIEGREEEEEEEEAAAVAASALEPYSEPEQPLPSAADALDNESSDLHLAAQAHEPQVAELELTETTTPPERGQPPSKKVKLDKAPKPQPGRFKTFATHCIAGAVGAVGILAAIAATTPLRVQEELYNTMG